MPHAHPWARGLLCLGLLLVIIGFVGCNQGVISLPTPDPTPTHTPTPAPQVPPGPYAPVVLSHTPRPGAEVNSLTATITLNFDQPMNRASLAEALVVRPETCPAAPCAPLSGDFEWEDGRTLHFWPQGLTAATRYRVEVRHAALSLEGVPLSPEVAFAFTTLSSLRVTRTDPAPGATDIRADAAVFVSFNRPIVPDNCIGVPAQREGACLTLPLAFSPSVMGQGLWVTPSLYRFDTLSGWMAGQRYEATLSANVTSLAGAMLEAPYNWAFDTALPYLETATPESGSREVPLDAAIRLYFNTPMEAENTGSAFSLTTDQGALVPGTITWEDGGALLVFSPTQALEMGAQYTVRIGERARALTSTPLENPQAWTFETLPPPAVVSFSPSTGTPAVDVQAPVRIRFSGALDPETLAQHISITPEVAESARYTYYDAATSVYHLSWDKAAQTEYCVTVQPGVADVYGNTLAESATSCFTTGDLPAYVGLVNDQALITLDARQPALVPFFVRNLNRPEFELFSLNAPGFLNGNTVGNSLRKWTETLTPPRNQALIAPISLQQRGGALNTGYYRLTWQQAGGAGAQAVNIAVVDYHVTLKLAATEALVWVNDLQTGAPISRTMVSLIDEEGLLIAASTTNADGLVRIPISPRDNLWTRAAAVVGEPGRPGFGIALTTWQAAAAPGETGLPVDYGPFVPYNVYVQTERPLYQPGQRVNFQGIVRRDEDARYSLPAPNTTVEVQVWTAEGAEVYSATLPLSEMGTFADALLLPEDSPAGRYELQVAVPRYRETRQWAVTFEVAAYRPPEFLVEVTAQQSAIRQGEPVPVVVNASYFFGGPVSQAAVQWEVWAEPVTQSPVAGAWAWGDYPTETWTPQLLASGAGQTDARGRFRWTLSPDLAASVPGAQQWTLKVTLRDAAGFSVTAQDTVNVHPARGYVGLHPQRQVYVAGEQADVELLVVDWEGVPVAGQNVTVQLARRAWAQSPAPYPFAPRPWVYTDTVVATVDYVTDNTGAALAQVSPPTGGAYIVRAEITDADGFHARAESPLWVSGDGVASWPAPEGQIQPVADAHQYQVGDTARILVPTPFEGPYELLLTIERGGILDVQHFEMQEANPILEVPLLETYAPNVYVSIVSVRGADAATPVADVRVGYVTLEVAPQNKTITVTLLPDQTTPYTPGATVELTVRTTDAAGRAVDAEVSLAVIDQALLNLRPDATLTLLDTFYNARPLSVVTGDSLLVLFNRVALQTEQLTREANRLIAEALGARLSESPADSAPVELPQAFPEAPLWEAQLRTGERGQTRVTFTLPDTLTTWVLEARAVSAETRVGQQQIEIQVTRPLLVRPVTPRFLVIGDRVELAAIVHNHTAEVRDVVVRLTATGGVTLEPPGDQAVTLEPGGRARVTWLAETPLTADAETILTFFAESDTYHDTAFSAAAHPETGALPIYRYSAPEAPGASAVLAGAEHRIEALVVPPDAGRATALTLRVEPSLAASLLASCKYLEHNPHTTPDVLISRLLVNATTLRALQNWEVDAPELLTELEQAVAANLERIAARQNADGGWGRQNEVSDLHLTAYTVLGLLQAQRAGSPPQTEVQARALQYIEETLRVGLQANERGAQYAFALYTLSEAGVSWPTGAAATLYADRARLGVDGRAYLALALGLVDASDTRMETLLSELRGRAFSTGTGVHWEKADAQSGSTDILVTAVMVEVLARLKPTDDLLAPAFRWLMQARQGDHWPTLYETMWAALALADYGTIAGEAQVNYEWGVTLNGVSRTEGLITATTLAEVWETPILASEETGGTGLWRNRVNVLEITREAGVGQLYYAAYLSLVQPVERITAEERGILLSREYCAVSARSLREPDTCIPLTQVRPGEEIEVRLQVSVPEQRHFVLLEDPYPAGMEAVTPANGNSAASWWRDPFERRDLRDDRALFFATTLPPGNYQVSYRLRAAIPGAYRVLPAVAVQRYFPEVWGRSAGMLVEVFSQEP